MPQADLTVNAAIAYDLNQIDRATEMAARRAQGALGSYTNNFKQFQQSIDAATSRVTAFGLTVGIFVGIKQAITSVVKSTIEMEKGLTDINVVLNLSSRNLKIFSEDLIRVAGSTGKTFDEAARAATEFSRQGLGVQETLKRTRDALNLSRLAGIDSIEAVTDLTAAMNSFNNSVLDSTQLVSKFVAVDQRFAVSSKDLAEAIKRVGSVAQDAGVDINQLIGLVTALQERTGRGGATIGTALNRILTRVQQPQGLDELASFGVKVREDLTRNVLPAVDILNNLVRVFDRLGQSEKSRITQQIGSLYQINQLRALLQDLQGGENSTSAKAAGIAKGASTESLDRSAQMNQTLFAQINRTAQNLKLTFSRIGESGGGNLKEVLEPINLFLEMFNKTDKTEGLGKKLAQGLFKGIADFVIGPGGVSLGLIIGKLAYSAFTKVGDAIKSFSSVQTVLREQLEILKAEAIEASKINALSQQRLEIEREILATSSGQMGGGGGRRTGGQAGVVIGRTAGLVGTEGPLPTNIYAATGRMGYLTRRMNQIDSISGGLSAVSNDPQMQRLLAEERAILAAERTSIRGNLNVLRVNELEPRASTVFGGGAARTALGKIDPILLNTINQSRMGKLQNRLFGASLGIPILSNMMGEAAFSGEGRRNRIGRDVASGIGNVGAGIGLGAMMTGPNPLVGGIIGGAITGLVELYKILKSIGDVMPEVNERLSVLKEKISTGENMMTLAFQLSEKSAGFRSGDIKQTPENISNFRSQMGGLMGQISASDKGVNLSQFSEDIKSGDPSRIEKYRNTLIPEQLHRSMSAENFIGGFTSKTSNFNDLFTKSMGLQSKSGESMIDVLKKSAVQRNLSEIQFPSIKLGPGIDETESIPGNFNGLIPIMARFLTHDEMISFVSLIKSNPSKAEAYARFLIKQSKTNKGIPSRSSLLSGNGTVFDTNPPASTGTPGINRSFELENSRLLAAVGIDNTRALTAFSGVQAGNAGNFSIIQARNQAALMAASLNKSPVEIEALRGTFGGQEIFGRSRLAEGDINLSTGRGLLGQLGGLRGGLKSLGQLDRFSGPLSRLEGSALGVSAGKPGSIEEFSSKLTAFESSLSGEESLLISLTPIIAKLRESIIAHIGSTDELVISEQAQKKVNDINTEIAKKMATPQGRAELALNSFRTGVGDEAARLSLFDANGAMFSDDRASGMLRNRQDRLLTGSLTGSGMTGAVTSSFTDQLRFNTKDLYRDLMQGAADVGTTLKSSFRDAFKTFLDGSQSASAALRSLGLSFANKLLDIAAQGTTNLLFGGLQSVGSAAFAGLSHGATGGFVTGGSGIRDDVPAMLNEGSFVIRKSSVNKYGSGFLNALNFADGGGVNFSPSSPLSNFALSDENNPQNRIRMEQESGDLSALMQYMAAKSAFESAKRQRRLGAVINLGVGLAGAGMGAAGHAWAASNTARSSANQIQMANYFWGQGGGHAMGGPITKFAGGGSVDNVPALLTGGEYVMSKQAVSRHGVGLMSALNRGEVPRFNTGGFVGETIEGGGTGGGSLSDSISRLINSNEKLRISWEKGGGSSSEGASSQQSQPLVGNISINVQIDGDNNAKADVQTQGTNTNTDRAKQGQALGDMIKGTVLEVIVKETRNGGLLEQNFQRRR